MINLRKTIPTSLGILVILLCASISGGVLTWRWQDLANMPSQGTIVKAKVVNWNTYRHETKGFELKYPAAFTLNSDYILMDLVSGEQTDYKAGEPLKLVFEETPVSEINDPDTLFFGKVKPFIDLSFLMTEKPEDFSDLETHVAQEVEAREQMMLEYPSAAPVTMEVKDVKLGKEQGLSIVSEMAVATKATDVEIWIEAGENLFNIFYNYRAGFLEGGAEIFPEALDEILKVSIVHKILSTFRFLE